MGDDGLTYEIARQASIRKWEITIEQLEANTAPQNILRQKLYDEFELYFEFNCGFCTYFDECKRCPLYWKEARREKESLFFNLACSHPCSQSLWKYAWCEDREKWQEALFWARKMLDEIRNTPEHELCSPREEHE